MAASPKTENDDLSQLTVDQLRKLLQEKGLPTTGKKKVLIERLLDDLKSNVVKPESKKQYQEAIHAKIYNVTSLISDGITHTNPT